MAVSSRPASVPSAPSTAPVPRVPGASAVLTGADVVTTLGARRALAVVRLLLGGVFLWPALDKVWGLGFATPAEGAWVAGASPSAGFLAGVQGPFRPVLTALPAPVADVLFVAALAGTGLALLLGVGLRVAAVAGGLLMLSLWAATWPLAPGSHNPVADQHLLYAALLVVLALTRAGDTWGLGGVVVRSGLPGAGTWLR